MDIIDIIKYISPSVFFFKYPIFVCPFSQNLITKKLFQKTKKMRSQIQRTMNRKKMEVQMPDNWQLRETRYYLIWIDLSVDNIRKESTWCAESGRKSLRQMNYNFQNLNGSLFKDVQSKEIIFLSNFPTHWGQIRNVQWDMDSLYK